MYGVTGNDRLPVGLAAGDDDLIRSAMALQRRVKEALCRSVIAMLAKEELDRIANAIDSAVAIHPLASNLDVGLVHVPFTGDATLALGEVLEQHW